MSDEHPKETVKRGAVNIQAEADKARRLGLLSYTKRFTQNKARTLSVSGVMLINSLFVLAGTILVLLAGSSIWLLSAGAVSIVLGVVGLINNVRFAL